MINPCLGFDLRPFSSSIFSNGKSLWMEEMGELVDKDSFHFGESTLDGLGAFFNSIRGRRRVKLLVHNFQFWNPRLRLLLTYYLLGGWRHDATHSPLCYIEGLCELCLSTTKKSDSSKRGPFMDWRNYLWEAGGGRGSNWLPDFVPSNWDCWPTTGTGYF